MVTTTLTGSLTNGGKAGIMGKRIRWGIVGTGSIARQFAKALGVLEDAELIAVSSRRRETADKFGEAIAESVHKS